MAIAKLLSRTISRALLLLSQRRLRSEDEDLMDVVRVLGVYRSMRDIKESIIVDSFQPISQSDRDFIRGLLHAPEDTRIIERVNPGLVGSFQIIYRGKVYSYQNHYRLQELREFFTYS